MSYPIKGERNKNEWIVIVIVMKTKGTERHWEWISILPTELMILKKITI